jgi:hypothetical protein
MYAGCVIKLEMAYSQTPYISNVLWRDYEVCLHHETKDRWQVWKHVGEWNVLVFSTWTAPWCKPKIGSYTIMENSLTVPC